MTKEKIFTTIQRILVTDFEIEEASIRPEALLVDDLDLDSIDFIDLVVKMKEYMPERVNPDVFKDVRTMQDVVDTLEPYINKASADS